MLTVGSSQGYELPTQTLTGATGNLRGAGVGLVYHDDTDAIVAADLLD
jgi:hypothetical protein